MHKKTFCRLSLLSMALLLNFSCFSQNPLFSHIYAADPSAHVWPNHPDTLWLYASHDVPGTNHHATMFDYHVFSTSDLKNWTDYGRVLSVDDVDWAISHAWAIDAVHWKGKYYLIYCMMEKATSIFRTGLATSDRPEGPFTDIGFIKNIEWGQDPALFVDNGIPYIFWGSSSHCYGAQLRDDLLSIVPETKIELTDQLKNVFEGPWVHKYKGDYYLSYPGLQNNQWPEIMYYATAKKPLGPYTFRGVYIPQFENQSGTNHGSIIEYKGDWIAFYHASWLSGGLSESRNLMADYLYYNPDGSIKPIMPTKEGLAKGTPGAVIIKLEAENGKKAGGRLEGTEISAQEKGFSGRGYVTGFNLREDYVSVLVQVAKEGKYRLKIRYSADEDVKIALLVNEYMYNGSTSTWRDIILKKSNGFTKESIGVVDLKAGDNYLNLTTIDKDMKVDYFELEQVK